MFRFGLLILSCLLSYNIFAQVIVLEHNTKPSIEVNLSILQEFQQISKSKKSNITTDIKSPEIKISSKALRISKIEKNKTIPSEIKRVIPPATTQIQAKPSPVEDKNQIMNDELVAKKKREEQRLAEAKANEDLMKKATTKVTPETEQKKQPQNNIVTEKPAETQDPKLSRAKNLLRKVEKSLLKTKSKTKEYNIDLEINKVNLANIHTQKTTAVPNLVTISEPVKPTPQKFIIKFPKHVNDIKSTMHEELNKIVGILTSNQDKRVRIIGYSSGDNKSNDIVTKRRNALEKVVAVRKYLVDRGVNTRQVSLQAAGDSTSKASNDGDRVEVMEIGL
jgi:outer membrane protein OmpA-like peptidoglycan-associated protein